MYCFSSSALGAVSDPMCLVSPELGCGVLGQSCCREELIRHDQGEYAVCDGQSATVLFTGSHNIVEVFTEADYNLRRTTGAIPTSFSVISGTYHQNNRETFSNLGATSGYSRFFICSLDGHRDKTFKTTCA